MFHSTSAVPQMPPAVREIFRFTKNISIPSTVATKLPFTTHRNTAGIGSNRAVITRANGMLMPFCPAADVCENVESSLPHSALHSICGSSTRTLMKYSTIKYSTDATTIYSICPMNHIRRPERSIIYGCSSSINGASQNNSTTPRNSIITALPSSSKNGSKYGESRECKYKTSINSKMYSRGFTAHFLKLCSAIEKQAKALPIFKSPSARARK